MRNLSRILFGSIFLTGMLFAGQVLADDKRIEEETTTTTTTQQGGMATQQQGTVSTISPSTIVIQPLSGDPVTYASSKTTVYVDETGKPVAVGSVQSGAPVVVYYDKTGGKTTATKVVVKKKTEIED